MRILVVNGGRNSLHFVRCLAESGHDVSFLSDDREACEIFAETYEKPALCGDALDIRILKQALKHPSELVAAVGDSESENFVVCELVKKLFNIRKTVSLVGNSKNIPFFSNNDIDRCVCMADMLAEVVDEEAVEDSLRKYFPAENPGLVVKEIQLRPKSKAANKEIWEIPLPPKSLIACILREGKGVIPQGNTRLKTGDRLILLAVTGNIDEASALFSG